MNQITKNLVTQLRRRWMTARELAEFAGVAEPNIYRRIRVWLDAPPEGLTLKWEWRTRKGRGPHEVKSFFLAKK